MKEIDDLRMENLDGKQTEKSITTTTTTTAATTAAAALKSVSTHEYE